MHAHMHPIVCTNIHVHACTGTCSVYMCMCCIYMCPFHGLDYSRRRCALALRSVHLPPSKLCMLYVSHIAKDIKRVASPLRVKK